MQNILILVDTSRASGRKFLIGVEKYTSVHTNWQVHVRLPDYIADKTPYTDSRFRLHEIDGVISRDAMNTLNILKIAKPKVVSDTRRERIPGCSTIVTDSCAIGRMAANYFFGLGYRHFAYCGFQGLEWSRQRFESYAKSLHAHGIDLVFEYKDDSSAKSPSSTERWKISEWLKQLPRPACVFACNDDRAMYILEACKIAGLNVPEEVAILGVDNDELVCNLSSPSLSSIELDFERAGFLAAEHLNALIEGCAEHEIISVSPVEVIERRSTDILALDDPDVVAALIYIRNRFQRPIQVADVVKAANCSRRELEKRFKKFLNKTIKHEIERHRIDFIKKKLTNSNRPVYQIAGELEFTDPEHFSRYFKKATGKTPLEFRRDR